MTGMQELLDGQALWDYDEQGRLRLPDAFGPVASDQQREAFTLAAQYARFAEVAFNPHQKRAPDGRFIKMGGKGSAGKSGEARPGGDAAPEPQPPAVASPLTASEALDSWVEEVKVRHPGVKLDLYLNSAGIGILSRIEVPKAARGRGTGEAILTEMAEVADRLGIPLAATPSGDYGGSVPKLKAWYRKHGFIPNKGRNRDYGTTEDLIRPPAGG